MSLNMAETQSVPAAALPNLKVVVALDGSPASATALTVARVLAHQLNVPIAALHVTLAAMKEVDVRRRLGLGAGDTKSLDVMLRVGDPATEILRATTEDDGVALLVMAARAEHSLRPLASVTLSVIKQAHHPVVLVRPELVLGKESALRPIRRLLLPVNGSPTSARALRSATELAEKLGASIDLLYVAGPGQTVAERGAISVPRYVDQAHHEMPHWSHEVVDRLLRTLARCPASVPAKMFLTVGDPGSEIVRFASEHDEDAVVLVRRSDLAMGRGKILWHLFEQSPLPVIVVVAPYRQSVAK